MTQVELEGLVTRLLDTESITAGEAIELLKLSQSIKEYIYIDRHVYSYYYNDPYLWNPTFSTSNTVISSVNKE